MKDMIQCKNCNYRYEKGSKECPNCGAKAPMQFKKVLHIILAILLVIALVAYIIYVIKNPIDYGNTEPSSSMQTITSSTEDNNVKDDDISSNNRSSSPSKVSEPAKVTSIASSGGATTFKQPTDKDNNISVAKDGTVSIKVPKWFLLKIEPDYDYTLTDKEANIYKFMGVTKNSDGSATYKIKYNDYHKFLLTAKSAVNAVVYEYSNNVWFSKIESDDGYNNIKIYTKYDSLDNFDDGFNIYISLSGLQATFYQYMHYNYSVGTTITVYNKNNAVLATYKFPELLK